MRYLSFGFIVLLWLQSARAQARLLFYSSASQAGVQMRMDPKFGLIFEICPYLGGKLIHSDCFVLNSLERKLSARDMALVRFHYDLLMRDFQETLKHEVVALRGVRNSTAVWGGSTAALGILTALQMRHWKSLSVGRRWFCGAIFGGAALIVGYSVNGVQSTQSIISKALQKHDDVSRIFDATVPPHDVSRGMFRLMASGLRLALLRTDSVSSPL